MIGLLLKLDVHPNGFICYAVHLIRVADIETDRFVIIVSNTQRHISASGSFWALSASLDITDLQGELD